MNERIRVHYRKLHTPPHVLIGILPDTLRPDGKGLVVKLKANKTLTFEITNIHDTVATSDSARNRESSPLHQRMMVSDPDTHFITLDAWDIRRLLSQSPSGDN